VLVVAGTLSLATGVIGIFLPLLPTTPFILLAAACYARSSKRLEAWLLDHRRLGPPIRDFRAGRGISLRVKIIALVTLWSSITTSALLFVRPWWARALMLAIAIAVSVYLLAQKTRTRDQPDRARHQ
jgi:uncharacterized membrane protein YbaN (DUF454 family)